MMTKAKEEYINTMRQIYSEGVYQWCDEPATVKNYCQKLSLCTELSSFNVYMYNYMTIVLKDWNNATT